MNNKKAYLTYNTINENDIHRGVLLDHRGLNGVEIQQALDEYVVAKGELHKKIAKQNKLIDELLNERNWYKKYYDERFHEKNSGY